MKHEREELRARIAALEAERDAALEKLADCERERESERSAKCHFIDQHYAAARKLSAVEALARRWDRPSGFAGGIIADTARDCAEALRALLQARSPDER